MNPNTTSAAAAPVAPSASVPAPAPAPLSTLEDFDRMAAASLRGETPAETPQPPATAPAEAATTESPVATSEPPVVPASEPADEVPEPTPEELAQLNEPGQRALRAEREKRKAAREENKTLQARIAELEAKLSTPTPAAATAADPAPPVTPAAVPANTPSVPPNLAQCRTFDQVEAQIMEAVQTQGLAQELMMAMNAGDRPAVIERLTAQKVTALRGQPLDQVDDATLRTFLVNVNTGAAMTIHQAPLRRQELAREAMSFAEAQKILPGLGKPGDPANAAFAAYVSQFPAVRNLGPAWPQMVAEGVAHRLSRTKSGTTPPPAAVPGTPPPVAPPTPRSAPSAPRTSPAALPARSEIDEVRERLNSGKGTTADMDRYAQLALSGKA